MSDEDGAAETELRARLLYWIREGMTRQGIKSVADFARAIGAPKSTVNRWMTDGEKAMPTLVWLGPICRALRLDPMLFALLPAIPADPLAQFSLGDESDLLTVTDAARLALLDTGPVEEDSPPAEVGQSARPRTRRRRDGQQCPR